VLRRAKTVDAVTRRVPRRRAVGRAVLSPACDKDYRSGSCRHGRLFDGNGDAAFGTGAGSGGTDAGAGGDRLLAAAALPRAMALIYAAMSASIVLSRTASRGGIASSFAPVSSNFTPNAASKPSILHGESVYAAAQSPDLSAENREAGDQREPGGDDE